MEELDTYDKYPGMGRGIPEAIRFFFKGGCPGGADFRVGDVGPDPPYGAGPEKLPSQGRAMVHQEASKTAGGGGCIFRWRKRWRKQSLKRSGYTSKYGRIWSRNILRRNQFWASVRDLFGVQETVFLDGGGNRRVFI